MNVSISGIHMETSPALQEHTETRLLELAKKFDHQEIDVNVGFVQEPHHHHLHNAEIAVHANGTLMHAEGSGANWYAALDEAADKLERQLERYKGRLQSPREVQRKTAAETKARGMYDGVAFDEEDQLEALAENVSGLDAESREGLEPVRMKGRGRV